MSIETPPDISELSHTRWKKPEFPVPIPSLVFLFHLECEMQSFKRVGDGPYSERNTVIFRGGRFEGPRLRRSVLPGGGGEDAAMLYQIRVYPSDGGHADWEIVRNDDDNMQTAYLDTRYNLQTHDGAVIYLQTKGTRTGHRDILESLGEECHSSDRYRMRLHVTAETGDPRYSWLNRAVIVASAGILLDSVIYDAYELL